PWSASVSRSSTSAPKSRPQVATASSRSGTATPTWWIPLLRIAPMLPARVENRGTTCNSPEHASGMGVLACPRSRRSCGLRRQLEVERRRGPGRDPDHLGDAEGNLERKERPYLRVGLDE